MADGLTGKEFICRVFGVFLSLSVVIIITIINTIYNGKQMKIGDYVIIAVTGFFVTLILVYFTKQYMTGRKERARRNGTNKKETVICYTSDGYAVTVVKVSFTKRLVTAIKDKIFRRVDLI